jgi:glyoxylase-like metal-dependent hydrolase (beta-lactamase superfamily II)
LRRSISYNIIPKGIVITSTVALVCPVPNKTVVNYDPRSGHIKTTGADTVIAFIQSKSLKMEWLLETHAHADHLSSARYIKQQVGAR